MYTYEDRIRAVRLYIQYDLNMAKVIRELGYPSRQMLYYWYKEFTTNGVLRKDEELGYSKYTDAQRRSAVQYYLDHGRSISRTIKALGYPGRTVLRTWLEEDLPGSGTHCFTGKTLVRYTQEQREQAVIRLCSQESTAKEIAADIGATESSVYAWRRRLLRERDYASMPTKRTAERVERIAGASSAQQDLVGEKESLIQQVEELKIEIHRLQMERDILEKAGEILKKRPGHQSRDIDESGKGRTD